MSKTQKTQMELVSTEESKSFKKKRMLEIRSMVRKALASNRRIDLMDFTGNDIPRVMVALQDEVMAARERHTRATKHISNARQTMEIIMPVIESTLHMQGMMIHQLVEEADVQAERIEDAQEHSIQLFRENESLRSAVEVLR